MDIVFLVAAGIKDRETMLTLEECKRQLVEFKQLSGKQYGIRKIGIFGSVARNEQNEGSDIDILVELEEPRLSLMYDLQVRLSEMFQCSVDLVRYRDSLRSSFKEQIRKETIYV